jgi:hypothetical protein
MASTLFDILGVLIAFVTILLILSIIVTALVQATQATLRLRSRNLQKGIARILESVRTDEKEDPIKNALRVLNTTSIAMLGMWRNPTGFAAKVLGPQVSWLAPEQLPQALKESGIKLSNEQIKRICSSFAELDKALEKRFLRSIRLVTLSWAILVAAYFQVSAPQLLQELSVNSELRAKYGALAPQLVAEMDKGLVVTDFHQVSVSALQALTKKYPALEAKLKQVKAEPTESETVEALRAALKQEANVNEVVANYENLVDKLQREKLAAAMTRVKEMTNKFAYLSIQPWPKKWAFFWADTGWPQWRNWVGVGITAILLTLGAPFWFNQLKTLVNLRDPLHTAADGENQPDSKSGQAEKKASRGKKKT